MKETEITNEEAVMLALMALIQENKRTKTMVYVLYGIVFIMGVLLLW